MYVSSIFNFMRNFPFGFSISLTNDVLYSFHVVGHSHILFGRMTIQALCLFSFGFILDFFFLLSSYEYCMYLYITPY